MFVCFLILSPLFGRPSSELQERPPGLVQFFTTATKPASMKGHRWRSDHQVTVSRGGLIPFLSLSHLLGL